MPVQTVIKLRRDTAADWTSVNPVLAEGEAGLETDTGLVKYGNGTSAWTALPYPSNSNTTYLVRNNTGSTILKGTLVAATGAEPSGRIDVAPYEVTGLQDSELRVMGIATANIASGVNGTVMSFGTLSGLDTRGTVESALAVGDEDWDAGDILYAHPTVDGKLTKVRPKHDLAVAFITVSHQSAGQLAVRIVPGNFHLEWLHDVALDSPANGEVLQFDGDAWVNATIDLSSKQDVVSGVSSTEIGYLDGVTSAIQTQLNGKAPATQPVSDKSANYTLDSSDANSLIRSTGSAITITVPDVLSNGQRIDFIQAGSGQVTFAGSSLTINSADAKLKTAKQYAGATIYKAGGAYYLIGNLG